MRFINTLKNNDARDNPDYGNKTQRRTSFL
jgi:hypothetical protein